MTPDSDLGGGVDGPKASGPPVVVGPCFGDPATWGRSDSAPAGDDGGATGGPFFAPDESGGGESRDVANASRWRRVATLAGATAVTTYVFLRDPDRGGAYPLCPSQTLLGIDCPLCGGLRGTHALLHGRIGEALDHNVLLPAVLGVLAVLFGLWLLPLVGRPSPRLRIPRWLTAGALAVLIAFGVVRNLPFDSLSYLASDA